MRAITVSVSSKFDYLKTSSSNPSPLITTNDSPETSFIAFFIEPAVPNGDFSTEKFISQLKYFFF